MPFYEIKTDAVPASHAHKTMDPLAQLNRAVPNVVSRFRFERTPEVAGLCKKDDANHSEIADPDIYNGTIATAHGYARLALHKPTGTICLFTSKASAHLKGVRRDDGSIVATTEGIEKSYIVSAYRNSGHNSDIYQAVPQIRRDLNRFNESLGERSEKHFRRYGGKITDADGNESEVYTNGRLAYKLEQNKKDNTYKVTFYAPTKRKDGHFVPFDLGRTTLAGSFARVSRVISNTSDYAQARHDLEVHWQRMSSRLWDEKNIYEGEGVSLNTKKRLSHMFNYVAEKGLMTLGVTAIVGLVMWRLGREAGIIAGLLGAATHTAVHHTLEESFSASGEAVRHVREARNRLNIEAYPFHENAANHFKIQTKGNIDKLCAKVDIKRFSGDEFEWLTAERSGMLLDHQHVNDEFVASSLRSHLLFTHQRGFSSSCTLPDPRTCLDVFQSGLIRLMHEKEDGQIVIYSHYRPDACLEDHLRLPEDKIKRLGAHIVGLQYNRRQDDFYNAFTLSSGISLEEMMKDLDENLLFRDGHNVSPEVRKQVLNSIRDTFKPPVDDNAAQPEVAAPERPLYMSGRPPALPPMQTLSL